MERKEILQCIEAGIGEAKFMLWAVQKYEKSFGQGPTKSKAHEYTNLFYRKFVEREFEAKEEETPNHIPDLIASRHVLDDYASRLEGAGLVNVLNAGRVRVYSVSRLGYEMMSFIESDEDHS